MSLLLKIVLGIVAVIIVVLILMFLRTIQLAYTSDQGIFSKGIVGSPLPNGLYAGTVAGPPVSWKGKKFDSATMTGINIFATKDGGTIEEYPFKFSVGTGAHDPIQVIKIDYNLSANPFWLRPVLDEVVQVAPEHYLGKLQVRLIPGYPFTLTFFRLSSSSVES